jgi:hypothetical protein
MQSCTPDVALTELSIRRDGYPALARWISRDPDRETFIFRRFDRLSARNLLNLQSQLIRIEAEIDALDEESWQKQGVGLRRWETYEQNLKDLTNSLDQKRKILFDELQIKIKEYGKSN